MKYNYKISMTDSAEYIIKAASQEKAMEIAKEYRVAGAMTRVVKRREKI